jgi:hypothetical protein
MSRHAPGVRFPAKQIVCRYGFHEQRGFCARNEYNFSVEAVADGAAL